MFEENINRYHMFIVLAQEKSFTKAAAKLGLSQSALSLAIKSLETNSKIRLFNRTTRRVSLTDAGERLLQIIEPRFNDIENELLQLNDDYNHATGSIRLTASDYATQTLLWPKLKEFGEKHPQIQLEINVENKLSDIIAERYDAGVRFGDQVEKDMIAMRISPDIRFLVVCSPEFIKGKSIPQDPEELKSYECINFRMSTKGGIYPWEFQKQEVEKKIKVDGQFCFNTASQVLNAAIQNVGFAYLPENMISEYVDSGQLITVLEEWCPYAPGLHLYYPNRQQHSTRFQLLLDALRC